MLAIGSTGRPRLLALAVPVIALLSRPAPGAAPAGSPAGAGSAAGAVTERAMLDETAALARALGQARRSPFRIDWERRLVSAAEARAVAEAIVRGGVSPAEVELDEKLLQRLGLLDAGASYLDALTAALTMSGAPAGFYDPSARRLLVPSFIPLPEQRPVLAHEIAHALQDQRFGLRRFLKATPDGRRGLSFDATLARQALIEGDAAVLAMEVIDPRGTFPAPLELTEMVQRARDGLGAAFAGRGVAATGPARAPSPSLSAATPEASAPALSSAAVSPSSPPRFLRELRAFPYIDGFAFVARARETASWATIDGMWSRPPDSTAQILHPEKYERRQDPAALELPPLPLMGEGLRLARADTLGELLVRIWLSSPGPTSEAPLSPAIAERAATGWRGDRVAIYLPIGLASASAPRAPPPLAIAEASGGADGGVTPPAPNAGGVALAWLTQWDSDADAADFLDGVEPRLAALAASEGGVGAEGTPTTDPIARPARPAVWRSRAGDSIFAVERRGALVALLLGAPPAALPSLGTMLDALSPRPGDRSRRPRPVKRDRDRDSR